MRRDIRLHTKDRLYSLFFAFFIKIDHTIHCPVVCDCKRMHAKSLCARNKLRDTRSSIQQAILCVNV